MNTAFNNSLIKPFRDDMSCLGFAWYFSRGLELPLKDALSEWMNQTNKVENCVN